MNSYIGTPVITATNNAGYVRVQGTVHALRTIAAAEGASGLMRGFWPTVLSNAPFSAIYYMLYSDLRQRFHKVLLTSYASPSSKVLLGRRQCCFPHALPEPICHIARYSCEFEVHACR